MRERLQLLIDRLERGKEDAVEVDQTISSTLLVSRKQLLEPISSFFHTVARETRLDPHRSAKAAVIAAARRFLEEIDDAHNRLAAEGCEILNRLGGELVDVIVLADFSTPVSKVLSALAQRYAINAGSVRVYVISSDRHFISSQDTRRWQEQFKTPAMTPFHLEPIVTFNNHRDLFSSLADSNCVLLTGAERIYPDGDIAVFPGIRTIVELAAAHKIPSIVIAESYKVQPRSKDEIGRLGTDSVGEVVEMGFLTVSAYVSVLSDHALHTTSLPSLLGVRQVQSESFRCCMRLWRNKVEGRRYPLGIIFDLDGTLIDSEPVHKELYQEVAKMLDYDLSEEEYRSALRGMTDTATIAAIAHSSGKPRDIDDLVAHKQAKYHEYLKNGNVRAIGGAIEFVRQLAERGFLLAVATSAMTEEAHMAIDSLRLVDVFPVIVSAEAVERGKPAPDLYLKAAELLGLHPDECMVYEDATSGVCGAVAAGMKVIGVASSDAALLREAGARMVIEDFRDHKLPEL